MKRSNHSQRFITLLVGWFCIAAILGWSLLPALGVQTRRAGTSFWLEICTAQGVERIALRENNDTPDLPKNGSQHNGSHCPLCLLRLVAVLPENPAQYIEPFRTALAVTWQNVDDIGFYPSYHPAARPRAPPSIG